MVEWLGLNPAFGQCLERPGYPLELDGFVQRRLGVVALMLAVRAGEVGCDFE